jgi:GTP-binding protein
VPKLFQQIDGIYQQYATRIGTGRLNQIIQAATEKNEPSLHRGRRIKFYYTTQVSTKPPTFVSFVNYPAAVHFSYHRYLINAVRQNTGLDATPVRLIFRKREGHQQKRKR